MMNYYNFPRSFDKDALIDSLQNQELSEEQKQSIENATNLHDQVVAVLKTIHDPEISANIWDLGLIYKLEVNYQEAAIIIDMTLTAPACPVADALPLEVKRRILNFLPVCNSVTVNLVWDPQWNRSMMTDEARLALDMW